MKKQVALITGAAAGLGFQWSIQLQQHGYFVIAGLRNINGREEFEAKMRQQSCKDFTIVELDLMRDDHFTNVSKSIAMGANRLDLLINNAGVNCNSSKLLEAGTFELGKLERTSLISMLEINAIGPLLLSQCMMPFLERSERPIILNISSLEGSISLKSSATNFGYAASKACLNMFSKVLSFSSTKVKTVALHPGWARTTIGGTDAPHLAAEKVSAIITLLRSSEALDSGTFIDELGQRVLW